jgi:hypothetical protein
MSFNAIQLSFCGLQLLCNASKTKCMLFKRSLPAPARPSSITTLDGSDLGYVDNYKYLGVWLDCKLSFQTHIKHLQSKIKSRIGFLFHNKASFTHAAKHTLVKLTILDFGDDIYKIASNTLLRLHQICYHSAICFVTKAPYTTHHCDLYALVGWPSSVWRSGPKSLLQCVQTWSRTTGNVWSLSLQTKVSVPNIKVYFSDVSNTYVMLTNANELLKNHTMWFSGFFKFYSVS